MSLFEHGEQERRRRRQIRLICSCKEWKSFRLHAREQRVERERSELGLTKKLGVEGWGHGR